MTIFTANFTGFTFLNASGIFKIPVQNVLRIDADAGYLKFFYFINISQTAQRHISKYLLEYSEIQTYNDSVLPAIDDLVIELNSYLNSGYQNLATKTITENYTILPADDIVLCDSTANSIALIFASTLLSLKKKLTIVDIGGFSEIHPIVFIPETPSLIERDTFFVLDHSYISMTIIHNAIDYFLI